MNSYLTIISLNMLTALHMFKGNIMDIVLSNTSIVNDIAIDYSNQLLISDHFVIGFKIEFSLKVQQLHQVLYIFDYKNADMDNLLFYLFDCDFSNCLQLNGIEYVWTSIKSHIYKTMTLYIPKKKIRRPIIHVGSPPTLYFI